MKIDTQVDLEYPVQDKVEEEVENVVAGDDVGILGEITSFFPKAKSLIFIIYYIRCVQ